MIAMLGNRAMGRVMKLDGADYFTRRAEQERLAADEARDPRARESHLELARRYDEAARGGYPANDRYPDPMGPASLSGFTLI